MKLILSLFFVLTAACCSAQMTQVFYFKNNGEMVKEADSSDYVRLVSPPDSGSVLFNVSEYYLNKKPKLIGKSSTINPLVFDGQCISYGVNGKRQAVLTYDNGAITGTNYLFHPNGKLYLSFTADTLRDRSFEENMRIISCMDSTGKALVTDGNGHYIAYDEASHAISEEGDIKDGKRVGEWHGTYPTEKVTYNDTYQDGKFISGYCTTAAGVKYTYTSRSQVPEFPGGAPAFVALVKKKLKVPAALKNKPGQILVSFSVSKEGKVSNPMLLGSISPEADQAIVAAVNSSPDWKPRIQQGLPVNTSWFATITYGAPAPAAKTKGK